VFTHFPLELVVYAAAVPRGARAPAGARWVAIETLGDEALPNLMRKVLAHALDVDRDASADSVSVPSPPVGEGSRKNPRARRG